MVNINQAYEKYLKVFPTYWDPTLAVPKSKGEFQFFYRQALHFKGIYEKQMCKGILIPVSYYMKTQFDQFLGVPNTEAGLKGAFKMAFNG